MGRGINQLFLPNRDSMMFKILFYFQVDEDLIDDLGSKKR